eukprot:TRINITY_DN8791_c0_g1_i1.p3 TRINITY_DN8791_c0_g1~~TRINITY_DN8791_c0_g1_i1.p3  ORF type:complete len:67 (+),score=22.55 TRINITY_DN8791_c0_g1_i1:459-659(+)
MFAKKRSRSRVSPLYLSVLPASVWRLMARRLMTVFINFEQNIKQKKKKSNRTDVAARLRLPKAHRG